MCSNLGYFSAFDVLVIVVFAVMLVIFLQGIVIGWPGDSDDDGDN